MPSDPRLSLSFRNTQTNVKHHINTQWWTVKLDILSNVRWTYIRETQRLKQRRIGGKSIYTWKVSPLPGWTPGRYHVVTMAIVDILNLITLREQTSPPPPSRYPPSHHIVCSNLCMPSFALPVPPVSPLLSTSSSVQYSVVECARITRGTKRTSMKQPCRSPSCSTLNLYKRTLPYATEWPSSNLSTDGKFWNIAPDSTRHVQKNEQGYIHSNRSVHLRFKDVENLCQGALTLLRHINEKPSLWEGVHHHASSLDGLWETNYNVSKPRRLFSHSLELNQPCLSLEQQYFTPS